MPRSGARKTKKLGVVYRPRVTTIGRNGHPKAALAVPKLKARQPSTEIREIVRKRAEAEAAIAEARRSHERLREAIEILPEGIVFLDGEGRYILWNKKYSEIYGATADLFKPGVKLEDTLRIGVERGDYPEAVGREEEWIEERLRRLYQPSGRHEQVLADGRCILIEERMTSDGGVIGLRVDITELKQREASFRLLFDGNPVPMILCALDDESILDVNAAAVSHYGYGRAVFQTMTIREIQAFASDAPWTDEQAGNEDIARMSKHVRSDGALIDVELYSRRLVHGARPAMLLAVIDTTERRRAEARLAFMAQHDNLTGLPNRSMLRQLLDERLMQTRRSGQKVMVACLDLDSFKDINETLGHAIGDRVLRNVGKRLRSSLRDQDVVGRPGADEFTILQNGVARPEDAVEVVRRLVEAISEPYLIDGQKVVISARAGIAIAPGDGDDAEKLLKNANLALSRAKSETGGRLRFFEPDMDAKAQARRRLEIDLRTAIESDQLRPYYQPLVDLKTGQIIGFESLVRWHSPGRGFISPGEFIPVAEETGLIEAVGGLVLRRACMEAAVWPDPVRVAVNLSPLQFRTGNLLAQVMDALTRSGLSPKRLELEITEALLMDKGDHVLATLHALRALGVHISMDDFGTGYSSLSYLRSFPFDKIKIDQSFVRGLDSNQDAQAIVRAIVNLGKGLGVTITAEGIETEAELSFLRAEGCHQGQGFLFSRARPNDEIVRLLEAQCKDGPIIHDDQTWLVA